MRMRMRLGIFYYATGALARVDDGMRGRARLLRSNAPTIEAKKTR